MSQQRNVLRLRSLCPAPSRVLFVEAGCPPRSYLEPEQHDLYKVVSGHIMKD